MSQVEAPRDARRGGGDLVVGLILVGLGILFFLAELPNVGRYLWPFFVIVPGLAFFGGMLLLGPRGGPLAIPGSIITMVGLMLLYQNAFRQFQTWSYAWALIVVAVGLGLVVNGRWSQQPGAVAAGKRVARIGAMLFLIFGVFFELVVNISGFWSIGRVIIPLLLIAIGVYLLFDRPLRTSLPS